ncbi:hypothetical protein F3Y22_tig00110195pilonHSYRG00049 [Hibiscus syriacus]|uniref:Uncharacterized protein n=1 Tax=Hibiscus syriacus TaxID=106335 RepID=A0A6A3BC27_HIBSY|nr:hypothetical protein F3Y22_tig00110195pilonHSYRG00049 [Hibiscus syriacus]
MGFRLKILASKIAPSLVERRAVLFMLMLKELKDQGRLKFLLMSTLKTIEKLARRSIVVPLKNGDGGFNMGSIAGLVEPKDIDKLEGQEENQKELVENIKSSALKDIKGRDDFVTVDLDNFFPEVEQLRKSKKSKRYGSLLKLQNQVLSVPSRRKRIKFKKLKLKIKDLESSELSGRSLSDSDLKGRWLAAYKEVEKTLELGKSLGIQISGEELEVVKELAMLEMN